MSMPQEEQNRANERLRSIVEREECVVNIVDEPIIERAVHCGCDFPVDVSEPEPEAVGLPLAPSTSGRLPRVAEVPITWECKLFKVIEFSPQRSIVFGEIVVTYIRKDLFGPKKLRVHVDRFEPYGRLGEPTYCRTIDLVRLAVPTWLAKVGVPRE
jgi:flavin reductase (DIM6/NTAB) family NADH-FMN oxidoreductase RutF